MADLPRSGALFAIAEAQRHLGYVCDLLDKVVQLEIALAGKDETIADLQERLKAVGADDGGIAAAEAELKEATRATELHAAAD